MADDRVNIMRGYKVSVLPSPSPTSTQTNRIYVKSTLHNPNTSDEAKQNAQSVLDDLGGDQPSEEIHNAQAGNKDPMRIAPIGLY